MPVVFADLRDGRTRKLLREAPTGDMVGGLYQQLTGLAPGHITDAPLRLLVVLPIDADLIKDGERLALSLLGVDPQPRTIVAAINGVADEEPLRDPQVRYRVLPNEFGRSPDVRFLDLRSPMVIVAHPRSGSDQVGTGPRDPWVRAFLRDLFVQLREPAVFDGVWRSITRDQPATIGMRIAALGSGRERAVADLSLRLAEELRPDREPQMGERLPDRWQVDEGLRPDAHVDVPDRPLLPKSVAGLARAANDRAVRLLSRSPSQYNAAVDDQLQALSERPDALARLFERAAAPDVGDGPRIDPIGATELDAALGGMVFGDAVAREWEQGLDAAERIGGLLAQAAERQAHGLSAAVLASWLRADADLVQPIGPAGVAAVLRDPGRQWAGLRRHISEGGQAGPNGTARSWMTTSLSRDGRSPRQAKVEHLDTVDGEDVRERDGRDVVRPPRVPSGLGWVLGSSIWRHRPIAFLYLLVTAAVLVLALAQTWSDLTGVYFIRAAEFGIDTTALTLIRMLLFIGTILLLGYALLSLAAAVAVRRWAAVNRFDEVPVVMAALEVDGRRYAVREVARCAVRREYARVARAAAETLEHAAERGSSTAMEFGRAVEASDQGIGISNDGAHSPHRRLLGSSGSLAGTDAGGLYRIYPLYVHALRALFARSLVEAIREMWPRIRGVFWEETSDLISDAAARSLADRLERVLEVGLRRGDLESEGVDPADELAERLWSDPEIRRAALEALQFDPDDPMPMLATPADNRLLDVSMTAPLLLAIPPTLQPLLESMTAHGNTAIIVTDALETAAAIRVFPFQSGLYDFVDVSLLSRRKAS